MYPRARPPRRARGVTAPDTTAGRPTPDPGAAWRPLYRVGGPRDLSHYETFQQFHATFYRHVEALSVTPFADRALDRGLTGVLVGLVRQANQTFNRNADAQQMRSRRAHAEPVVAQVRALVGLVALAVNVITI